MLMFLQCECCFAKILLEQGRAAVLSPLLIVACVACCFCCARLAFFHFFFCFVLFQLATWMLNDRLMELLFSAEFLHTETLKRWAYKIITLDWLVVVEWLTVDYWLLTIACWLLIIDRWLDCWLIAWLLDCLVIGWSFADHRSLIVDWLFNDWVLIVDWLRVDCWLLIAGWDLIVDYWLLVVD